MEPAGVERVLHLGWSLAGLLYNPNSAEVGVDVFVCPRETRFEILQKHFEQTVTTKITRRLDLCRGKRVSCTRLVALTTTLSDTRRRQQSGRIRSHSSAPRTRPL